MSPPVIEVAEVAATPESPAPQEVPRKREEIEVPDEPAQLEEEEDEQAVGILGVLSSGATGGFGTISGGTGVVGVGPRPTGAPPKVRVSKPTVGPSSSMDPAVIRRIVRRHMAAVRHCYEQGLTRDPKLQGRVVVRFAIERDGAVVDARIDEGIDATVDDCVKGVFEGMRFPQPRGGRVVVRYPLVFHSNP